MEAYPEIVVHTFSFAKWEENTYAPLSASKGLHFAEGSAEAAGTALADFTDSLYSVFFPIKGYDESARIFDTFMMRVGTSFVSYGTVRNVDIVPQVNVDTSQDDIPEESSEPGGSTVPDTTESPEPEVPASESGDTPEYAPDTDPTTTEESIASSENEPPADAADAADKFPVIVSVICGIIALILLVITAITLVTLAIVRKVKRKKAAKA